MSGFAPLWETWMDAEPDAVPGEPHEGTASERIAAARAARVRADDRAALEKLYDEIKALMQQGQPKGHRELRQ